MIYGSPNSYVPRAMSFAAQRTPLVPHEEARLDGSYLSKMSQVDFPNDEQYAKSEGPECSF